MEAARQLFGEVRKELQRWGIVSRYCSPITLETEVFRDLRIYGDDLYELVVWLHVKFGVETNIELGRYAPPETPFLWLQRRISRRKYESLRLRDVVAAIEAKRWVFRASAN